MTARLHKPRFRTDWFRVLADLRKAGYPYERIAEIVEVPTTTLRGWGSGSDPAHSSGHDLLDLWSDVTGLSVRHRPMTFG